MSSFVAYLIGIVCGIILMKLVRSNYTPDYNVKLQQYKNDLIATQKSIKKLYTEFNSIHIKQKDYIKLLENKLRNYKAKLNKLKKEN